MSKTITTVYDNTGRFCIYQGFGSSFGIYRTFSPTTSSLLSVMNENNLNTNFTYDAFGRLLEIHYPDGNTDMVEYGWNTDSEIPNAKYYTLTHVSGRTYATERYYDLLGRNICMRENGYYSDTCFDLKGNVYRISEPYIRGTSDADKLWHDFQYDQYGRITNVIGPYTNESYQYSGYTTTVTDNLRQTVSTQITDAAGRIRYASDQGGTVTYNYSHILYNDNVATQTDITACGHNTSIISDASGNQLKITDPNAGVVTKRYNAQNQLLQQTDQDFRYSYDNMGRLTQRIQKNNQYETFQYDNMDRLTSFTPGTLNGTFQTFSTVYDAQGNILSNTLAGIYSYGSNKPHAVTEVTPSTNFPNAISADSCETDYNVFNQPSRIAEGDVEILLEYGADNQRVKAVFKRNGDVERTRYYISANYEKGVDAAGVTTHYNYIYGATGLAAICVRRNGADSMYYVHHDHLGSYTHITDSSRQVIRVLHFDPYYESGWLGNQYVKTFPIADYAKYFERTGKALGWIDVSYNGLLFLSTDDIKKKVVYGIDAGFGLIGIYGGGYGLALSLYYSAVIKNYPQIQQNVNKQYEDRANMILRGYIPVGTPGFPFK